MTAALQAIEAEAYAVLHGSAAVTALSPVYQHVPENTPPPVVIVADMDEDGDAVSAKDDDDVQVLLTIVSEVRGKARKPLLALMGAVKAALNGHDVERDGWRLTFRFRDSVGALQEDGQTYVGNSRFVVTAFATD